jgi:hypothetical protein
MPCRMGHFHGQSQGKEKEGESANKRSGALLYVQRCSDLLGHPLRHDVRLPAPGGLA